MTSLLVLSGSNGFVIPNIILGAFIYCMLRPQFSKTFFNETHFIFTVGAFQKQMQYTLLVSAQNVHTSISATLENKRVYSSNYMG